MADGDPFDCFLSHNSKDKPAVRALAAGLRAAGVSVWLDEEQLRPGVPWQPLLESGIRASRSVAVMVGAAGIGPWEDEEQQAALNLAVREKLSVIPVLLPDATSQNGRVGYGGCDERPTEVFRGRTVPVASLPANPWGLYEVAGNVWEWVQDCWHPDYEGAPVDGRAWLDGAKANCAKRAGRGGSWHFEPKRLRSDARAWGARDDANTALAFRLARTP